MDQALIDMFKSYGADQDEKKAYPTINKFYGEQYMGVRPLYSISRDNERVRVHIETFKGRVVSKSVVISIDEFKNHPGPGQDKAEAQWALDLCGVPA